MNRPIEDGIHEMLIILERVKEQDTDVVKRIVVKHFQLALGEIDSIGINCIGGIGTLIKWPSGVGNK